MRSSIAACETLNRFAHVKVPAMLVIAVFAIQLAGCATTNAQQNKDKVVVVVGASSGFGEGVALALADQGAKLVLAARRTPLLNSLAKECEVRGAHALVVTTDVSQAEQVQFLADTAVDRYGRIDVWINLAGVGAFGRFEDIPLEDHHRVIDVSLNGVVNGSYFAMKQFRKQGNGTLINIASVAGRVPFPYETSYVASKAAIIGLGGALNQELRLNKEKNIHVSTISPFATDTPWFDHAANYTGHKPRMVMLDPPEKVVQTIVDATVNPKPEITVGYKSKMAAASHRIARRFTENMTGNVTQKVLIEDSPAAEPTAGTLYEPMFEGDGIDAGVRRRLAEGDLKKTGKKDREEQRAEEAIKR
ncbi:MAG: SDR family NAD(P)-dependent oxidoreductase [Povalibacter sp.]